MWRQYFFVTFIDRYFRWIIFTFSNLLQITLNLINRVVRTLSHFRYSWHRLFCLFWSKSKLIAVLIHFRQESFVWKCWSFYCLHRISIVVVIRLRSLILLCPWHNILQYLVVSKFQRLFDTSGCSIVRIIHNVRCILNIWKFSRYYICI